MKTILFATHENIDRTAVAKAMFYDVAVQLRNEHCCFFYSAAERNSEFTDENGIERITYRRASQGRISIRDCGRAALSAAGLARMIANCDILYIRSYPMMILAGWVGRLQRKRVIFDTRGLFFEELYDSGKVRWNHLREILYKVERLLLRISSDVICVSEAQKEYYIKNHGKISRFHVIYNCAVPAKKIFTNDDLTIRIAYVGSLVRWHCPDRIVRILTLLSQRGFEFEFHCITKDIPEAHRYFGALSNTLIYEHDYRRMPIKFDLGLCLIKDTLSKRVCFPVKFAEYLVAKTPVAFSDNIDVCNRLSSRRFVGIPIDLTAPDATIAEEIMSFLERKTRKEIVLPVELEFPTLIESVREILRGP